MTIMEAQEELKKIKYQWIDFDYWACLQLSAKGFDGNEYVKRMSLATRLHKARETELKAFHERMDYETEKMIQGGATSEEINMYYRSQDRKLKELVTVWRNLE
jgi:hypothetical protein